MRLFFLILISALGLSGCGEEKWKAQFKKDCTEAVESYFTSPRQFQLISFDSTFEKKDGPLFAMLEYDGPAKGNTRKKYVMTCLYSRKPEDEMPDIFPRKDLFLKRFDD